MGQIWQSLLDLISGLLESLHTLVQPLFGQEAGWGWAIILLTVLIRVFLLPLAIKQTRSQRAMQRLAPEIKKIQAKYKVDRSLMRTNPEKYKESRQKQQEATMALYKEHGVNPASGCLPLLAQMPIFIALFRVLRGAEVSEHFQSAHFYFVHNLTQSVSSYRAAGDWADFAGAVLLLALMAVTTFLSSRQMMATGSATAEQAQQQKMMMYLMPLILLPVSYSIPVGVLLYWVTTNVWTLGQQYVIFRKAAHDVSETPPKAPAATPKSPKPAGKKGKAA